MLTGQRENRGLSLRAAGRFEADGEIGQVLDEFANLVGGDASTTSSDQESVGDLQRPRGRHEDLLPSLNPAQQSFGPWPSVTPLLDSRICATASAGVLLRFIMGCSFSARVSRARATTSSGEWNRPVRRCAATSCSPVGVEG
jgi:hypothetical protein